MKHIIQLVLIIFWNIENIYINYLMSKLYYVILFKKTVLEIIDHSCNLSFIIYKDNCLWYLLRSWFSILIILECTCWDWSNEILNCSVIIWILWEDSWKSDCLTILECTCWDWSSEILNCLTVIWILLQEDDWR